MVLEQRVTSKCTAAWGVSNGESPTEPLCLRVAGGRQAGWVPGFWLGFRVSAPLKKRARN